MWQQLCQPPASVSMHFAFPHELQWLCSCPRPVPLLVFSPAIISILSSNITPFPPNLLDYFHWHSSISFLRNWSIIALRCWFVSTVQQCDTAVRTHLSPPSWAPPNPMHPFRSSQSTEPSSLCYKAAGHWLSGLCMGVYMSVLLCQLIPLSFSPIALCPQVCSLCLYLY